MTFVRLTDQSGDEVLVNLDHVSHITSYIPVESGSGKGLPTCAFWIGDEYGEGSQQWLRIRGTIDEVLLAMHEAKS